MCFLSRAPVCDDRCHLSPCRLRSGAIHRYPVALGDFRHGCSKQFDAESLVRLVGVRDIDNGGSAVRHEVDIKQFFSSPLDGQLATTTLPFVAGLCSLDTPDPAPGMSGCPRLQPPHSPCAGELRWAPHASLLPMVLEAIDAAGKDDTIKRPRDARRRPMTHTHREPVEGR